MADQTFDPRLESILRSALAAEVANLTVHVTADQVMERAARRRGRIDAGLHWPRMSMAVAAAAMAIVIVVAGAFGWSFYLNQRSNIGPSASATPSARATAPASADPSYSPNPTIESTVVPSPAEPGPTPVHQTSKSDVPLGWSSDGTELLVQRNGENLFVLHADGTETQVTNQLTGITTDLFGSSRPSGATISPDGSRVVFAGLTKPRKDWTSCHDGALFSVSVDGGPAAVLFKSQVPENGIVRDPTFSPDGTQIAFADGYCDHDHSVWVMNADGSNAHKIVATETLPGAGHVYVLAWSPSGDRIALRYEGPTYTFAADGSDFRQGVDTSTYCWPGRRC